MAYTPGPVKVFAPTLGDLLKWEIALEYTREAVTFAGGTVYPIGSVVAVTGGKYALAKDTDTAAGIVVIGVDATAGDKQGVILARGPSIVSQAALLFDASVADDAKKAAKVADLTKLGIVVRAAA